MWLFVLCTCISRTYGDAGFGKGENNGCSAVKLAYGALAEGFDRQDVPRKPMSGTTLRICPQSVNTCCTPSMEDKLSTQSQAELDKIMADKIDLLRETFISRTAKFDAFFTELLENAKRDLHDMFVRTYGLLYQQNSHVFIDLFSELRNYYKGHDINLLDALDNFFSTLLQKMFELLNSQYTFDQQYLQCVTEHMDELKPFGDVPFKLSLQVKRAFVAARTFVQGLAVGRDVIIAVSKIQPSSSCHQAVMKMLFCPYCKGLTHVKPCNNFCMNVMKGCLAYHSELNHAWNNYIEALLKVAGRLEGPFNIEMVVDPIDVKISDAIMNFQENSETVSSKIFQGCGQPQFGRKKRDTNPDEYQFNDWKYDQQYVRPTTAAGTSLDRLVRDIKKKIEIAKDFWISLPHKICNEWAEPLYEEYNCWNGLGKSRYMPDVTTDGLVGQINNPEVDVDIRRPNSNVNQQILQLKLITNKLNSAYNGLDVGFEDYADIDEGSGSGSGGGSGSESGWEQPPGRPVHPPYRPPDPEFTFTYPTMPPVFTRRPGVGGHQTNPEHERPGSGGVSLLSQRNCVLLVLPVILLIKASLRHLFGSAC